MNIDLRTLAIFISLTNLMQVIALFTQYRLNRTHAGLGWWTLGTAIWGLAFLFNAVREHPIWGLLAIVANNFCFIFGFAFIYVGVLRFFDQRERRVPLYAVSGGFVLVAAYFTLIDNNFDIRRVNFWAGAAVMSLLIAHGLWINRKQAFQPIAKILAFIFLISAVFLLALMFSPLVGERLPNLFSSSFTLVATYIDGFILSTSWTFGFIILVNQRLNAEFREAKENSEMIFNTSPDAVLITRLADGLFVDMNEGFFRLTGFTRADVIGKSTVDINMWKNPADRQKVLNALKDAGICENLEVIFNRKDGSELIGMVSARLIALQGAPYIISVTRDISERKQAEDALRESEEKFRTMADLLPQIVFETDPIGNLTYVNKQAYPILGYSEDENMIGVNTLSFYTPESRARAIENIQRRIAGQPMGSNEYTMRRKDGSTFQALVYSASIIKENKPAGLRGIIVDISELKQVEEALREAHDTLEQRVTERTAELSAANLALEKAARIKDEFLASMSHELRTPLTGILGLSEVMQMPGHDPLTEKQSTYLGHIHNSGQRLQEIINDMLDFSIIEAGKFAMNLTPCSLKEICQSSLQLIESQAAAKGLQSSFLITPDSILINADARRLQKILVSLLSNAVKFTPKGGGFGIETRGDRTTGQVHITVWDDGIGIKEEDLPRLFQPFVQLDARLARQFEGTGLGLALALRLTELHGGSISVQSVVDQGSRFTVSLPWQPA